MKILVLSDIHGNSIALAKAIESAGNYDYLWVLGDLVDYGPEPHIVIDMIRDLDPDVIVRGNHDHAVAFNTDCRCNDQIHELSVYTRMNISLKLLSREQVLWLRTLPLKKEVSVDNKKYYIVHGSPSNPLYGYLIPSSDRGEMLSYLKQTPFSTKPVDADVVLVGHSHIAFKTMFDEKLIANPGSIGQPRDGSPNPSYMIIDTEKDSITHIRIEYDINAVISKYIGLGIEEKYLEWLKRILVSGKI